MITLKPLAISRCRALIMSRRVDQRWLSTGATPTILRTGGFRRSVSARSANRTPQPVAEMLLAGRCRRFPSGVCCGPRSFCWRGAVAFLVYEWSGKYPARSTSPGPRSKPSPVLAYRQIGQAVERRS